MKFSRTENYQLIQDIQHTTGYSHGKSAIGGNNLSQAQDEMHVSAGVAGTDISIDTRGLAREDVIDQSISEIKGVLHEQNYLDQSFGIDVEEIDDGPNSYYYESDDSSGVNFMTIQGDDMTREDILRATKDFIKELKECGHID